MEIRNRVVAFALGFLLASSGLVFAWLVDSQVVNAQSPNAQDQKEQMVKQLFSRRTDTSVEAVKAGLAEVQVELDRLGSTMNAQQVVLGKLEKAWQLEVLKDTKTQMRAGGIEQADQLITSVEERIASLKAELNLGE